jgi:hypothetical protein
VGSPKPEIGPIVTTQFTMVSFRYFVSKNHLQEKRIQNGLFVNRSENGVKNIKAAGYDDARTVTELNVGRSPSTKGFAGADVSFD